MEEKTYLFRREDTSEVVEVPWAVMIQQDAGGYITYEGVPARRCHGLEAERDGGPGRAPREKMTGTMPLAPSDAMGFGEHQWAEFEADRVQNGFTGVEFTRDPLEPTFFQVRCSSVRERDRYIGHRGMANRNSIGGVRLTEEELASAEARVIRKYGHGRRQA